MGYFVQQYSNFLFRREVNSIFKLFCLKIIVIVIGSLSSKIAFYLLIMTYVWTGHFLNAEIVFYIKSCFHKLRHLLSIMLPLGVTFGAEFGATIIRLKTILNAEEVSTPRNHTNVINKEPNINLHKVTVKIQNTEIVQSMSFDIKKGLNMVVGNIGTGKTLFIKTLLEDYKIDGNLTVYGSLSYASQEPWLFPATIQSNILFGSKMDDERYRKVLEVCALNQDLTSFSNGDNTLVGDNGVNMSKGQQARINLARAVYRNADIYLLDDCLAALDGHVSDFIFRACILEFLKDKLCVFVCNNLAYRKSADYIFEIKNGIMMRQENTAKDIFELKINKEMKCIEANDNITKTKNDNVQKLYKEEKKSGKVDLKTYNKYIIFGGGYIFFIVIMLMYVAVHGVVSYSEKLVGNWVTLEQDLADYILENKTSTPEFQTTENNRTNILNLYTILIISSTGLSLLKALTFFSFNRKASINLHKAMISKIMNAKMIFFDSHLIGNVLNRFAKDLGMIDEYLPFVINDCFEHLFILLSVIFLVASVNALFLIPAVIFFLLAYLIRFIYLKTGRSLQRLEAATRSPLLGHINASLEGLTTIRAFKAQEVIKEEFDSHQDLYTSANYTLHNSLRALAFVLDAMCSMFITIVILKFLFFNDDTSVGNIGLAITQAFHLSGLLQYSIRRWADFENQMTSVERVLQYTEVDQEQEGGEIVDHWPKDGNITYEKVSLTYSERKVLKNISFNVKPKQKIGIVGRTGAGKSSIISTLFRLYDIEGSIKIDSMNTQQMNIKFLRSNIAIIPQDPVLISGTVRENFDPLNVYKDEEIWKVIKTVKLEATVVNLTETIDSNYNLSAGQKQLICLARAILRNNKIVVLDEATANLDNETDSVIREVINKNFSSSTVIIIAHRLSSVMSSDIVMVVDDGQIVEQDEPKKLLDNKNSLFSQMINHY